MKRIITISMALPFIMLSCTKTSLDPEPDDIGRQVTYAEAQAFVVKTYDGPEGEQRNFKSYWVHDGSKARFVDDAHKQQFIDQINKDKEKMGLEKLDPFVPHKYLVANDKLMFFYQNDGYRVRNIDIPQEGKEYCVTYYIKGKRLTVKQDLSGALKPGGGFYYGVTWLYTIGYNEDGFKDYFKTEYSYTKLASEVTLPNSYYGVVTQSTSFVY